MDLRQDLYTELVHIVRTETRFLRHYIAKVTDNNGEKGAIKITITEFGEADEDAIWAFPRERNIQVPKVGGYVEVYFMNGDPSRPIYMGWGNEMADQPAKNFTGKKDCIIFEDYETDSNNVVFDRDEKQYNIKGDKIVMLEGEEPYVLGDKFKTQFDKVIDQLTTLANNFSAWTPVPNDGGAALKAIIAAGFGTKPQASSSDILSEKITGK